MSTSQCFFESQKQLLYMQDLLSPIIVKFDSIVTKVRNMLNSKIQVLKIDSPVCIFYLLYMIVLHKVKCVRKESRRA